MPAPRCWSWAVLLAAAAVMPLVRGGQREERRRRLGELRKHYGIAQAAEPDKLLQGFRLGVADRIAEAVVVEVQYQQLEGVCYRFKAPARNGQAQMGNKKRKSDLVAVVRTYRNSREAIDGLLLTYGQGYAERPDRGNHKSEQDIGDLSLASSQTLAFARRNVTVFLVSRGIEEDRMDAFARRLSSRIDQVARASGTDMVSVPEVTITVSGSPAEKGMRRSLVTVSAPAHLEFHWGVIASSGQVKRGKTRAVVEWRDRGVRVRIAAYLITRDGFLFNVEKRMPAQARTPG